MGTVEVVVLIVLAMFADVTVLHISLHLRFWPFLGIVQVFHREGERCGGAFVGSAVRTERAGWYSEMGGHVSFL